MKIRKKYMNEKQNRNDLKKNLHEDILVNARICAELFHSDIGILNGICR